MKHKNVIILGTSHIASESIREVKKIVDDFKPDIICLELDRGRLEGLITEQKSRASFRDIRKIGLKSYIFVKFGSWIQNKLGRMVGSKPGDEMKTAYLLAQSKGIRVSLIDQDIIITLKRLSKAITWKEKFRFVTDLIKGFFGKGKLAFDPRFVPSRDVIDEMVGMVKDRYPGVYKVLIEERNHHMARKINLLRNRFPEAKIFAVVGAGHASEMEKLLEKMQVSLSTSH